jgi:ribosome production factor 2
MEKRAPKVYEDPKNAIFIRATTTSQLVNTALADLCTLKKPYAIHFTKKNDIHPFDNETSLEFFCRKNDASLFIVGSHSKKRPHNLVIGRTFNYQMLDMMELSLEKLVSLQEFKTPKCAIGMKPCFVFNGELFSTSDLFIKLKNLLLDMFCGEHVELINLAGLEHVISVTAVASKDPLVKPKVYLRVYTVQLKKSGSKVPRVELQEMGPSMDFTVGRTRFASVDMLKEALRMPKELTTKKVKNVSRDGLGDRYGRVHMEKQDLGLLQTRKMKGLKKKKGSDGEDDGEDMDVDEHELVDTKRHKS